MASSSIVGFNLIVIFSLLLGSLVLGTATISSRVHRQPAWYGFLVSALVYEVALALSMGHQTDAGPPAGLCIFQAVLLSSIPGWVAVAFGSFVVIYYFEIRNFVTEEEEKGKPSVLSGKIRLWSVVIPVLSFMSLLLLNGLVVGLDSKTPRASLNRYKLYCIAATKIGVYVGGAIVGVATFLWIAVIIKTGFLYRAHYSRFKRGETIFDQLLCVFIRTTAITISVFVAIVLYLSGDGLAVSYCLALPSMIVFVAYGTQRDILKSMAFKREKPSFVFNGRVSTSSFHIEPITSTTKVPRRTRVWKSIGYNWNVGTKTQTESEPRPQPVNVGLAHENLVVVVQ